MCWKNFGDFVVIFVAWKCLVRGNVKLICVWWGVWDILGGLVWVLVFLDCFARIYDSPRNDGLGCDSANLCFDSLLGH